MRWFSLLLTAAGVAGVLLVSIRATNRAWGYPDLTDAELVAEMKKKCPNGNCPRSFRSVYFIGVYGGFRGAK